MDVHVPAPITRALIRRGVDVMASQDDGTTQIGDPELLDRATALNRALFSRDKDLLSEATARQRAGRFFAGLIYAHQLRVTIGQCINDLEIIAKAGNPEELHNRVEHLPLR
jgi:hypothetical protein